MAKIICGNIEKTNIRLSANPKKRRGTYLKGINNEFQIITPTVVINK